MSGRDTASGGSAESGAPDSPTAPLEPIAIVGMACRFPGGADTPAAFWRLLRDGVDAVKPIARDGFDVERLYDPRPRTPGRMTTRWGGFLEGLERFDAEFFGVSPREAATLDPAHRLLMETAWEACEDAAIDPTSLAGEAVGVFVGQWLNDFEGRLFADLDGIDFHMTTGSGRYASSGRLSYLLGATGPSLTVDTACSSSLVAVHLACQSLRAGESRLALAAGVNVILQPHISVAYSQSGMMAPDGRCKFGDANGDGYVRSEGAGVVLLKPLARALADGDPIHAVIRGSAVNNDGRSSGHLATPSRAGQAAMLRAAYASAGVSPAHVGYVEAHGTGTRAGDPVEIGALGDVLAAGRAADAPCLVGSVKTNVGHTEGAAGMAGLLKCVLALRHEEVPASLHLREPNPAIPWAELPFTVPRARTPWRRGARPRVAGVSGFGITGTNAHVVLEEAPASALAPAPAPTDDDGAPRPLVLSAGTARALRALAAAYADLLESPTAPSLRDACATAARHRAALEHRAAFVVGDRAAAAERLRRFAAGDVQAADAVGRATDGAGRRVAFAFPGQGGQWLGMARELLAHEPAFRDAIARCDAALPAGVPWTVLEQLQGDDASPAHRLREIGVLQPVLLAVEIALAAVWRAWGVRPDAVVGHSMGEVGAAHLAGALSLEEAMRVICARSALLQRTSGQGAMALVELSAADAARRIEPVADRVSIAVSNAPRSTVVSGDPAAVAALVAELEAEGVFCRRVQVDVASHSPQMDPLAPELVAALHGLSPRPAELALYSTVDARQVDGGECDAAYWGRNLREPVRFGATVERALADGVHAVIEVGPHPTLLTSVAQAAGGADALAVPSLRRGEPERATMLASLGALWAAGHAVAWDALFPARTYARVPLPHYPWQRERHWTDAAPHAGGDGAARPARASDGAREWLHAPRWVALAAPSAGARTDWLVVGTPGAAAPLVAALRARGAAAVTVAALDEAAAWLADRPAADRRALGVALLDAADAAAPAAWALDALRRLQRDLPADRTAPRLWWVTRGAHALPGDAAPADTGRMAEQGGVWGAGAVFAEEHPTWWGGIVDLDAAADLAAQGAALADHLCDAAGEDRVAIRGGARHALRLERLDAADGSARAPRWRADASYLITGGFGGVAREIASAMVRDGARRLVLLGRTALPPRAEWAAVSPDCETGRRIAAVRALEHAGAAVHLMHADVADEAALRGALDAYQAEGWPAIRGVVHAAAVLDNRLTHDMDAAAFDRVLRPKLAGALALDRLLPELDLFVLFSSISAFWGPAGMANYAAANAGLDALAGARRARGQHALSVQWGPWANVGLHEGAEAARQGGELERAGVGAIPAAEGTALFGELLACAEPVVAVLPMDWAAYRAARRGRVRPLFRAIAGVAAPDGAAAAMDGGVAERLRAASPLERRALLEPIARGALGRVLRAPAEQLDARRPFGVMGLDSLMAVEFRNRLETAIERPLPATLAWNYPTIEQLVAHLDGLFATAPEPGPPPAGGAVPAPPDDAVITLSFDALASLSDDDAARALRGGR